jgi:hypothetical protein
VKLSDFEKFTFNDFVMPEKPDAMCPGQAHIVCVVCYNKYDNPTDLTNWVPPHLPKDNEYWYVWMLDHTAYQSVLWMKRHHDRWHPEG